PAARGEPGAVPPSRLPPDGQRELARRQYHEKDRQRLPVRKTTLRAAVLRAGFSDAEQSRDPMVGADPGTQGRAEARRLGQAERNDGLAQRNARMQRATPSRSGFGDSMPRTAVPAIKCFRSLTRNGCACST